MTTITIRELHAHTGAWARQAARYGEILVTDHGKSVARIVPHAVETELPYFARRKPSTTFKKLAASGKLGRGTDSTQIISSEREDRGI